MAYDPYAAARRVQGPSLWRPHHGIVDSVASRAREDVMDLEWGWSAGPARKLNWGAPLRKKKRAPAVAATETVLEHDDKCHHCLAHHGKTHRLKSREHLPRPWHAYLRETHSTH